MMTTVLNFATFSSNQSRLLVVDPGVLDYQQLLEGLRPGYAVLVLDDQRDGVAQISEALARLTKAGAPLESLHILSHGSPGTLYLGHGELSLDTLEINAAQLKQWGTVVDAIALYGCNVAAGDAGAEFVEFLHELTGAQIAASVTKTGSAQLGGDWQLAVQVGEAEPAGTELAFNADARAAYKGVLASITVDVLTDVINGGDGNTSLREAIIQANGNGEDDVITLPAGTIELSIANSDALGTPSPQLRENAAATGDLDITSGTITLQGDPVAGTIIDANSIDRVFEVLGGATLILENITVSGGNIADAGSQNVGNGGGIEVLGTLQLINSTVSGNTAGTFGGGIATNNGNVTLTNSTVSGNTAGNYAGGIDVYNNTTLHVISSTVANNDAALNAGGISSNNGNVTLTNSIIADNTIGGAEDNTIPTRNFSGDNPTLQGNNLIEGSNIGGVITDDPGLGDLADNGGPTQTHLPADNSPAVDAGRSPVAGDETATDQRGEPRFIDGPDADDIAQLDLGAVENCYLTGTLIATDQGEVTVETLQIGDLVKLDEGSFVPVKWVGHETYNRAHQRPHPFRTYPILFKAGSLGNNLPQRDLYVSPDHGMFFDGLLINAGAMTNGTSIIQVEMEHFVYHHIELEQHSLLIAEGTPSESFLPQNQDRSDFDNGDEYEELYPNHNILSLIPMSFPRVSSKRQLPRSVSKKLTQIAESLPGSQAETKIPVVA